MSNSLSQNDGEHDAADIGARQRRIENVGIFGKPDAQRGLGGGGSATDSERVRRPPPNA